jgi:PAS domain S-box-containing protein
MTWQYSLYMLPLLAAVGISLTLAGISWRYREHTATRSLIVLALALAWWSLTYLLGLARTDLTLKLFAYKLMYPAVAVVPVAWMVFAASYTGRDQSFGRRGILPLLVVPSIAVLLMWTNGAHSLFWASIDLVTRGSVVVITTTKGVGFWVFAIYSYLLLAIGTGLILRMALRSDHVYRGQAIILGAAALLPWGANVLYLTGFTGVWDLTNLGLALSGVMLMGTIYRRNLLELTPVARNELVNSMEEAVIVINDYGQVADLNPAAENLIDRTAEQAIGSQVTAVSPDIATLVEPGLDSQERAEITITDGNQDRHYEVQSIPIQGGHGSTTGQLLTLRDVTARYEHEQELAEINSLLSSIIDNLPIGVLVEDTDRTITATNTKLFEIFDISGTPEDLIGRDCAETAEELKDLFADPDGFSDRVGEILAARDPVFDEELAMADGRTLSRSYVPYSLPDGEGNLWLYRDITDRSRRVRTLERQSFLFDSIQEIANAGIWEYEPETEELFWSDGVRSIHHVDASYEPTLDEALEFYHPADRDEISKAVKRAIEDGESYDLDLQIVRESGEVRDVRARGEALTDESESTTILRGVFQDITEQKEYERRLDRLHNATRDLMQADTHASIAEVAVETARDTLDLPITGLWLHDETTNVLRPIAITDAGRALLGEPPVFEPGGNLSWESFQTQEAKMFEDVASQPGRHNPETPLRSEIILPLGNHGVMNIGATERATFDETDRSLAHILAANVEAALTRADQQQELARQTERLDLALEGGQLGVWDWNVQTDEVTFDERWAEMLGHSLDEIEPHLNAWEKRAHPEDLPDAEAALEAHFAGETEYYTCDHRMQTKSGDWIWVRDVGKVVERDDDGEPVRAVGIHQDITRDKERERKLRETLEQTQKLIRAETPSEAATRAVEIAAQTLSFPLSGVHLEQDDERLEPAAVTDGLREQLGFSPTYRRIGGNRRVDEVVWDVYASGETRVITNLERELPEVASETPSQSAIIHPLANHGVFITSATSAGAFDEFDEYLAELLATILVTTLERVQQEQQIESQRDSLDLLNQMVRHDIRNDLQILLARLDFLAEHVDEAGVEHLDIAQNSAKNAVELTQTARDLSEVLLQDGTDTQPVAFRSVIQRQLEEVRAAEPHASITIDGSIPGVTVIANDMLDSVVRNLLTNAVQHTDKETPEVMVSATEQADNVLLRVADNGPGVPDEQKDAIFGKGEKGLDSSGTGIGLYLVSTLVESYGGDVWVEDNDPEGAVFIVELPKEEWASDY